MLLFFSIVEVTINMACVVNGVSDHSRKFSFWLQGTMGHRVSCKPLSHLLTIPKYFQLYIDSSIRWCHWCLRLHPYFRICLPQPQFDDDTISILLAFTDYLLSIRRGLCLAFLQTNGGPVTRPRRRFFLHTVGPLARHVGALQ